MRRGGWITVDLTRLRFVISVGGGLLLEIAEHGRGHGDLDIALPDRSPLRGGGCDAD